MKESTIHVGLGTATLIVVAAIGGTCTILLTMSAMVTSLTQNISDVHQRVNNIQANVEVQTHMMEGNVRMLEEIVDNYREVNERLIQKYF